MGNEHSLLTQYDIEDVQAHVDGRFTQDEIEALYRRFCALDRNGKGYISGDEFLSIPEFALNPLANRLLGMLEGVNFKDFVKWLAAFSPRATAEERAKMVLKVHDVDNDGVISPSDLTTILKDLSGSFLSDNQRKEVVCKALQQAGFEPDASLSFTHVLKLLGRVQMEVDIPIDD